MVLPGLGGASKCVGLRGGEGKFKRPDAPEILNG